MSKGKEQTENITKWRIWCCKRGLTLKFATEQWKKHRYGLSFGKKKDRTEDKQHEIQDFVSAINETVLADSEDLETRD